MRHIVSLKVNGGQFMTSEEVCTIANASLSTAGPELNMSVMPFDRDQLVEDLYNLCVEVYGQGSRQHGLDIGHFAIEDLLAKHGIQG